VAEWQQEHACYSGAAMEFDVVSLDLDCLASVRRCATTLLTSYNSLDILVNNAGLFRMGVAQRTTTADGYESHFGVNYLAPYLLSNLLLPALQRSTNGQPRIVNVSSKVHCISRVVLDDINFEKNYTPGQAYSRSKLAQIMFTSELQARLPVSSSVKVLSLHPGNVLTDVSRDLHWVMVYLWHNLVHFMFLTPREGAMTTLVAATDPDLAGANQTSCLQVVLHSRCCPRVSQ